MDVRKLLIDEQPIEFPATLACAIGDREAIALSVLKLLLSRPERVEEMDGRKWVVMSRSGWNKRCFAFWSEAVMIRTFRSLLRQDLVIMKELSETVVAYTIDEEVLKKIG